MSATCYFFVVRPAIDLLFNIAFKMTALSTDAFHDLFAIYLSAAMNPKFRRVIGIMSAVGCGNEQFAGHTTDRNTGGRPKAIINNDDIIFGFTGLAKGILSCCPCANDGNRYLARDLMVCTSGSAV